MPEEGITKTKQLFTCPEGRYCPKLEMCKRLIVKLYKDKKTLEQENWEMTSCINQTRNNVKLIMGDLEVQPVTWPHGAYMVTRKRVHT
jgi:hypothetical protein